MNYSIHIYIYEYTDRYLCTMHHFLMNAILNCLNPLARTDFRFWPPAGTKKR